MRTRIATCLLLVSLCWIPPAYAQSSFRRADSNGDGAHDLTDIVFTLNFLFLGGIPPDCMDAADANDSGDLDLTDPVATANWQFLAGAAPPFPLVICGIDLTPDSLGCRDHTDCTGSNRPPVASFSAAPESGPAPLEVRFDASASVDADGAIAEYEWDFGDGAMGIGVAVSHVYPSPGAHTAKLTATDNMGSAGTAERGIIVRVPPGDVPTASFTAAPLGGRAPLTVDFDASASFDPDGTITDFEWDFGDGAKGAGAITAHTFAAAGRFTVVLTVTDNDRLSATERRDFSIDGPLPAESNLTEPPECPPADPSGGAGCQKSGAGLSHGVYGFSGEFFIEQQSLRIKGRGLDFVWALKYRSRIGPKTAMGNGWDFSYNIWIEPMGDAIVLHDGNTRADGYEAVPGGTAAPYVRRGFFRELTNELDGSYKLRFAGGGAWLFHPLDGGPRAGKIRSVTDRNGNTMNFSYDASGRLFQVSDTLDRLVVIAHNPEGFIESVTDFAGRKVQYAYYRDGDAGGSAGDLKSATTPAVTGTPAGNDFPNGKTTVFTYSKGFADDALNHNLLTITDPKGQTWLRNTYMTQNDLDNDRIVRQVWGNPGDSIDWSYAAEKPSQENQQAVLRTIVNDRMGNVTESFFDDQNRLVLKQGFTGRADPGAPTTLAVNRPTGRLRATDPPQFTTKIDWNADFLITETTFPNGNITRYVYESDLDPNASYLARGSLREIHRLPGSHQPAGDQALITELFEYDADFGSCCGSNFVTRHTDARGNVTIHQYDDHGNRLRTQHRIPEIQEDFEYNQFGQMTLHVHPDDGSGHRRRDAFTYSSSGPQTGYIEQDAVDIGGFELTTRYEHDLVGNVTRIIDPRGHDTLFTFNQLDQLVRKTSREVEDGSGHRWFDDFFWDGNDNLFRVDLQNKDDQGVLQANAAFTTLYAYDVLNQLVRKTEEVDPGRAVVTEFEYDANQNLVLTRYGEATRGDQNPATSGPQPENTLAVLHDERNKVFRRIRAAGHPAQSTTQFDYDPNGNLTVITELEELLPRTHRRTYDGFDRLVRATDSMGNERLYEYDPSGNRTRKRLMGEAVDLPGGQQDMHLEDISFTFDAMDRNEVREGALLDSTGKSIGDGRSTTRFRWSANSQILSVTDDNGHETLFSFDTANRRIRVTDPKGNSIVEDWDRNSNRIAVTRVEKSDLGSPDETFKDQFVYDNLDRLVRRIDAGGSITDYRYDSRGNLTMRLDGLRVCPSDPGNVTRYVYDGLSRLLHIRHALTSDGTGSGTPAGEVIAPRYTWDDSSRLVRVEDPRGSATTYAYDPLNRRISTTFADGTIRTSKFDVHDNPIESRDPNGTLIRQDFDLLNRLVRREIEPGSGVSADTTLVLFAYDGLSRIVRGEDDDSVVTRSYDSLSGILRETQNGQAIDYTRDGEGNVLSMKYPGGRTITYSYDALGRPAVINELEELVGRNHYFGPTRLQAQDLANNTRALFEHDKARRVVNVQHTLDPLKSAAVFDHRTFTWDQAHRRIARTDCPVAETVGYRYDSLHRLVGSSRTAGQATLQVDYQLDGVGNRMRVSGGPDAGQYTMSNTVPDPADLQMNQYTSTPSDGRLYDRNGNLTQIDEAVFEPNCEIFWDSGDRMVGFHHASGVVGTYAYDVFGRRIQKRIEKDGKFTIVRYFYDGSRLIEEQGLTAESIATYVYGDALGGASIVIVDACPVTVRRGGIDYYFHQDDLGSVVAITDGQGSVVERYDFGDFGGKVFLDPSRNAIARSAIGNQILFRGGLYDEESGFYLMGGRYYDPRAGRYVSRDPRGVWGDARNLGDPFAFAGNSPWTRRDGALITEIGVVEKEIDVFWPGPMGGIIVGSGPGGANNCGPNCHWDGQRCICRGEIIAGAGPGHGFGVEREVVFNPDEPLAAARTWEIDISLDFPQLGQRRPPSAAYLRVTGMGGASHRGSAQVFLSGEGPSRGRALSISHRSLISASDLRLIDRGSTRPDASVRGLGFEFPVDWMNPGGMPSIDVLRTEETIDFEGDCEVRCEVRPGSQYVHCKVVCRQGS